MGHKMIVTKGQRFLLYQWSKSTELGEASSGECSNFMVVPAETGICGTVVIGISFTGKHPENGWCSRQDCSVSNGDYSSMKDVLLYKSKQVLKEIAP